MTSVEGTDFSGSNRIKYELWETKSPAIGYFLALHANINITHTTQHAVNRLVALGIRPRDLTVLRQRSARPEQELISRIFSEQNLETRVHECTYKEYIWDYCIDEILKAVDPPNVIENYTNQNIVFTDPVTGKASRADSALSHMVEALQKPSGIAAHLVVAPGGMGKTSLCLSLAKKLHFRNDLRSSVILIQAESIKKHVAERGGLQSKIESIYDIYELYAKYHGHHKLFERSTFDLAIVCGNLTIIIDGLDELSSLFQEQFDITAFLRSLRQLHDQLGGSNVLLTSRNNVVSAGADLGELSIATYELLGFNIETCKRYVTSRLQNYPKSELLIQKVMVQIAKVHLQDQEGRIVPFFADISTTIVEDELREGKGKSFDISDDPTPYPSNNDLTDHIVYSILRREEARHALDISVKEVVEIISSLVADYGKRWPSNEMRSRLQMLYEAKSQGIYSKLLLNPLLVVNDGDIELRYSLLSSYFEVIFILQGILRESLEAETARSLAKLGPDSEEARELRRYFSNNLAAVKNALCSLIPKLRDRALAADSWPISAIERETIKTAIASLLHLFCGVKKLSIDALTETVLDLFGISLSSVGSRTLEGLFIKGAFPPLDFTNLIVTNSRFQGYKNLLSSRFDNTKFMYSIFEDCADTITSKLSLDPAMIDTTCDAGNLREVFALANAVEIDEKAVVQSEAVRFLHSFFKGDRFVDNKVDYVKFSSKVPGLSSDRFSQLVALGYLVMVKEKTVGTFFDIASDFKPSVRRLLADGYPDGKMKQFLAYVRLGA